MAILNDNQVNVLSESALQGVYAQLVNLKDFAHTYSELEDREGAAIIVPVYDLSAATDFNEDSNNYAMNADTVGGEKLTLDKHIKSSMTVTDRELAETGIQFLKDGAEAIGRTIGRGLNKTVMGMFTAANVPVSAALDESALSSYTYLNKVAAENDIDVGDSIVVLDPEAFSALVEKLPATVYGGPEAIRYGYVPGLAGFRSVVQSTYLPEGVNGVIVNRNTVGIASRYLAPMADAYPAAWKAVDPDSGFTIGFRCFEDLAKGRRYIAGEALFGAKIFFGGAKSVRLIKA